MAVFDSIDLSPAAVASIEAALRRDPSLEAELAMIVDKLRPELRSLFWRAFAQECEAAERPASAVLRAFEATLANLDEVAT